MSAKWPGSVATDADLYVAKNALATTLASTITNSVTTIPLTNTTNFPTAGGVTIDQEVIFYTGISGSDLTGCTRGSDGTSIAAHTAGVPVSATIIAFHHNGLMAEIEAIESWLTTSVVANPLLGNVAAGGYKITGLAAGSTAGDSLRYEQVIGQFLLLSGGTLTGTLRLPDSGTFNAPQLQIGAANNGIYTGVANRLGLTCGGVENTVWGPTFCSLSSPIQLQLQKTSNQLVFDHLTGGDTTITVPAAASARVYTIPDAGADTSFFMANGGTLTGALLLPNGAVGTPSLSFSGDPDTGLYGFSNNYLYVAAGGLNVARFINIGGAGQLIVLDGTATAPVYSFYNSPTTGIYCGSTNYISFSTNGTSRGRIKDTGVFEWDYQIIGKGTATNDSAGAGYIGEAVSSIVAFTNITTSSVYFDITSISLTAGDWDISILVDFYRSSSTFTSTAFEAGIGTASGTNGAGLVTGSSNTVFSAIAPITFLHYSPSIASYRVSIASTTTYYLKGYCAVFTVGNPQVSGRISARRVR
jgi:hypothetical protein